jgi:hypothetical protein
MSNNPEWKFRIMGKDEINQDPFQSAFFTTQEAGGLSDVLVRESIQNSLDAKIDKHNPKGFVSVRFCFSRKSNEKNIYLNNHIVFKNIYPHILSADNGVFKKEIPTLSEGTPYLVIEDYRTYGLDGSVTESDIPQESTPIGHNFFWFWRNVGRTGKTNFELGKWGLGKTVFPASSVINTFWGLTNRFDDNKNYLMGLSVLKTHHINNEKEIKRYPYGYFGKFNDPEYDFFATPTDDESTIEAFRETFNIKREKDKDPGLSVVIPFPRKEITSEAIIKSVLKQYFYPIISGNLIVEVVDDDNRINKQINTNTIFELLEEMKLTADYSKLFKLCLWSLQLPEQDYITLKRPPLENASRWQMDWFFNDEIRNQITTKMELFEEGKAVEFKVPVRIKEIDGIPQICYFKVFMEKDELLREADAHFVRDGITITGQGKKVGNKFVRAIVVIEDKDLVKLLGLAENPAHTEWQKNSSHFRGKYEDGDKVINFIELTVDKLCGFLLKPAEGIDREMMRDVFYIELPDDGNESDESDDDDGPGPEPPSRPPTGPGKKSPFVLERETGGFVLKKNPAVDGFIGSIKVATAYMVAKGSPLKGYSKYDFDLAKNSIVVTSRGVNNLEYKENRMSFNVNPDSDFSIEVSGFDVERDLYIKANHYDSEI